MGIVDRARQTAEQARSLAARPAENGAGDDDPSGAGDSNGTGTGNGRSRSPFAALADKLDPNTLADLVQKAGAVQEKVNATLRDRGLAYRISEICFTATFPPQVSFYIAPAEPPPTPAPPAEPAAKPAARAAAKATKSDAKRPAPPPAE